MLKNREIPIFPKILTIPKIFEILTLPKNQSIVLYCRTNNRSTKTANILKENGFDNISVIEGGITEWVRNGNDIDYTTYSD